MCALRNIIQAAEHTSFRPTYHIDLLEVSSLSNDGGQNRRLASN